MPACVGRRKAARWVDSATEDVASLELLSRRHKKATLGLPLGLARFWSTFRDMMTVLDPLDLTLVEIATLCSDMRTSLRGCAPWVWRDSESSLVRHLVRIVQWERLVEPKAYGTVIATLGKPDPQLEEAHYQRCHYLKTANEQIMEVFHAEGREAMNEASAWFQERLKKAGGRYCHVRNLIHAVSDLMREVSQTYPESVILVAIFPPPQRKTLEEILHITNERKMKLQKIKAYNQFKRNKQAAAAAVAKEENEKMQ